MEVNGEFIVESLMWMEVTYGSGGKSFCRRNSGINVNVLGGKELL
jgi:hypothetical protein